MDKIKTKTLNQKIRMIIDILTKDLKIKIIILKIKYQYNHHKK